MTTSKMKDEDLLTFFSHAEKMLVAKTENRYIAGAEPYVAEFIDAYNTLSSKFNWLFDLAGREYIPEYALSVFGKNLDINDYLYTPTNPYDLSITAITHGGVEGEITAINSDYSFGITFYIKDYSVGHIPFEFSLTDNGHENQVTTVVGAEITLEPPTAYSETFAAIGGESITARLQADFETGFEIISQPQFGYLDTSGAFSFPDGGLFTYTAYKDVTDGQTDSFTFVATNGSSINGGRSEETTIYIDLLTDPIFQSLIGTWHVYEDAYFLQETWGSACHDHTGQYSYEGYVYNIFTAQTPTAEMTLRADGSMTWGFVARNVSADEPCTLTGEYEWPGEKTASWTYLKLNSSSYVSVPIPYSGGGEIVEANSRKYEWLGVSAGRNENYRYRWEKQ